MRNSVHTKIGPISVTRVDGRESIISDENYSIRIYLMYSQINIVFIMTSRHFSFACSSEESTFRVSLVTSRSDIRFRDELLHSNSIQVKYHNLQRTLYGSGGITGKNQHS